LLGARSVRATIIADFGVCLRIVCPHVFTLLILINSLATVLYVILSTRPVRKTGWSVSDVLAGRHLIGSMSLAIIVSAGMPPGPVEPSTFG
jgi:hypothetical protein